MSIALDLNLYIRDKNITLPLDQQGFLYTMAFYVGSNAKAWVTPETLSRHLGMTESGVKKQIMKAKKSGLLKFERNPKNKNTYLYGFADFLINYHQIRKAQKENIIEPVPYREQVCGKPVPYREPDIGTIGNRFDPSNSSESHAASILAKNEKAPKGTYKATIKAKQQRETLSNFVPSEKAIHRCKERGINSDHLLKKFKNWNFSKNTNLKERFSEWIEKEIVRDECRKNEIKSTVPWANQKLYGEVPGMTTEGLVAGLRMARAAISNNSSKNY